MKSLDLIEEEKQARENAEALLRGIHPSTDPDQQAEAQTENAPSERLFTRTEVELMISERVTQERADLECRMYILVHYFDLDPVIQDRIEDLMQILTPKNVDDLKEKMNAMERFQCKPGETSFFEKVHEQTPREQMEILHRIFGK